jgi:hypothetical protein
MKITLKILAAIVACVIVALVVLRVTGLDPQQRRAGLWLKGDVTAMPVDFSFADKTPTLMVETHPWYLIPHSVTIFFVTYKNNLYLHADFDPGQTWPNGKSWTAGVGHDPRVRIKIGNRVFDGQTAMVTDQAEYDALFEVFRAKYPKSPYSDYRRKPDVFFLHVLPE